MDFNFSELKQDTHSAAMNNPLSLNLGGGENKEGAAPAPDHSPKGSDGKKSTGSSLDDDWLVHVDDSKITEAADDFGEFLTTKKDNVKQELSDFGNAVGDKFGKAEKKGAEFISDLTRDFMNAERSFFGTGPSPVAEPVKPAEPAKPAEPVKPVEPQMAPVKPVEPVKPAGVVPSAPVQNDDSDIDEDDDLIKPTQDQQKSSKFYDDFADNDSPSISYNPSPIKKNPVAAALKEQDNEKFISSEDLLGDFKEERTATPEFVQSAAVPTQNPASSGFAEEVNDLLGEFKKPTVEVKKPEISAPAPAPAPAPQPSKVEEVKEKEPLSFPTKAAPPIPQPSPSPPPPAVPARKAPSPVATPAPTTEAPTLSAAGGPKIVSVEEIFYKYGLDVWFKPERLHPRVESLIYWRDVKKSGIVFGAGLITLLAISCFSVISVFAYLSLLALVGTIAFRIYKTVMAAIQKTSEGHPFKEYLEFDLTISQERVQQVTSVAVAHVNGFTAELRRLFLVDDLVDSLKFGVILWFMTYIGAWFNGMTLVMLAFVSLFTLPKIYENNKQSIDSYLDLVRTKVTEITDNIDKIRKMIRSTLNWWNHVIHPFGTPMMHSEQLPSDNESNTKNFSTPNASTHVESQPSKTSFISEPKNVKSQSSTDTEVDFCQISSTANPQPTEEETICPSPNISNLSGHISAKRELERLEEQHKLDQEYLYKKYELLTLADEQQEVCSEHESTPKLTESQKEAPKLRPRNLPTLESVNPPEVPTAVSKLQNRIGLQPSRPRTFPKAYMYKSIIDFADDSPGEFLNWIQSEKIPPALECPLCKQHHTLVDCTLFKMLPYNAKWELIDIHLICEICLDHSKTLQCENRKRLCGLNNCIGRHHVLLHKERNFNNLIIPVTIHFNGRSIHTVALLNLEQSFTMLDKELAKSFGMNGIKTSLSLEISPRHKPGEKVKRYPISVDRTWELDYLTLIPVCVESYQETFPYLYGLPLTSHFEQHPGILIGGNNKQLGVPIKLIEGKHDEPIAIKTHLGWIVHSH